RAAAAAATIGRLQSTRTWGSRSDGVENGGGSSSGEETATDGGGDSSESAGGLSGSGSDFESEFGSENEPEEIARMDVYMGSDTDSDDDDDDAILVQRPVQRRRVSRGMKGRKIVGVEGPAADEEVAVRPAAPRRRRVAIRGGGRLGGSAAAAGDPTEPPAVDKPKRLNPRATVAADGSAVPQKRRRTAAKTAAADLVSAGAEGVVPTVRPTKRARRTAAPSTAGGAPPSSVAATAAAAASGGAPSAPSRRPNCTVRDARGNFVKIANSGSRPRHSFRFEGRSAVADRALKASQTRRRRIINGKVVITGGRVPHAAGQGADYLEGFGQGSRCFKCGATGHWARDCPGTQGLDSPSKRAEKQQQQQQQGG
ncbi:hypothetical protein VaNZ11_010768, partial [Volvox africanus]